MFNKKTTGEFKTWHILLLAGILLTATVLGVLQNLTSKHQSTEVQPEIILNATTCSEGGGTWNECASACRGQDTEVCILMCVSVCECQNENQCPFGYTCGDKIDGTGICKSTL